MLAMKKQPKTVSTVITNLTMLMAAYEMTFEVLANKSGVTDRMIHYILDGQRKPSVEVAEKLASAFGLTGWQLLIPHLTADLAKAGKLDGLIKNYSAASKDGKIYIERSAENEAKTAKK